MRVLTRILNLLTALLASAGFLAYELDAAHFAERVVALHGETSFRVLLILLACAVVLLNIYCAYRYFQILRTRRRAIEVTGKNGLSSVSIDAVQNRLLDVLSKLQDVAHPRVRLSVGGNTIRCALEFALQRSRDITGRADEVKQAIRDAFMRMIPGGPTIEITVNVTDIEAPQDVERTGESSAFSGPVYPVHPATENNNDD